MFFASVYSWHESLLNSDMSVNSYLRLLARNLANRQSVNHMRSIFPECLVGARHDTDVIQALNIETFKCVFRALWILVQSTQASKSPSYADFWTLASLHGVAFWLSSCIFYIDLYIILFPSLPCRTTSSRTDIRKFRDQSVCHLLRNIRESHLCS